MADHCLLLPGFFDWSPWCVLLGPMNTKWSLPSAYTTWQRIVDTNWICKRLQQHCRNTSVGGVYGVNQKHDWLTLRRREWTLGLKMCHLLVRVQVMKNEKRTPNWFSQPALFKLTLCVLATCCKLVLLSLMIMRMAAALFANMHDHTWQSDSNGAHPAPQQQNDRTTACIIAKKLDRQQHDVRIPKHSPWHVASCHVPEAHTLEVQTRVCALQRRPGNVCTCGVTVVRNCECTIRACPVCAHERRCSCLAWKSCQTPHWCSRDRCCKTWGLSKLFCVWWRRMPSWNRLSLSTFWFSTHDLLSGMNFWIPPDLPLVFGRVVDIICCTVLSWTIRTTLATNRLPCLRVNSFCFMTSLKICLTISLVSSSRALMSSALNSVAVWGFAFFWVCWLQFATLLSWSLGFSSSHWSCCYAHRCCHHFHSLRFLVQILLGHCRHVIFVEFSKDIGNPFSRRDDFSFLILYLGDEHLFFADLIPGCSSHLWSLQVFLDVLLSFHSFLSLIHVLCIFSLLSVAVSILWVCFFSPRWVFGFQRLPLRSPQSLLLLMSRLLLHRLFLLVHVVADMKHDGTLPLHPNVRIARDALHPRCDLTPRSPCWIQNVLHMSFLLPPQRNQHGFRGRAFNSCFCGGFSLIFSMISWYFFELMLLNFNECFFSVWYHPSCFIISCFLFRIL